MLDETVTIRIPERFRGPPGSGNGGYVAGLLAAVLAPEGPVAVRLQAPPPLEAELRLRRPPGGGAVLAAGERVLAEARLAGLSLDVEPGPSFEQAGRAARDFRGFREHPYPGCFVCGPDRAAGDGLRIFAGPLGDGRVAAPWIPDASLARRRQDEVSPEFLWSGVDCPGAFAFEPAAGRAVLLGELCAEILGSVRVGERCVLAAWPLSSEGRKHFVGSALFDPRGRCAVRARATWIEVDPA